MPVSVPRLGRSRRENETVVPAFAPCLFAAIGDHRTMKTAARPSPLRLRRLARGLRLRDVEKATGINDVILSRIERGELPLVGRRLSLLADFYAERAGDLSLEMRRFRGRRDVSIRPTQGRNR